MADLAMQPSPSPSKTATAMRSDVPHAMGRADFVPAARYYDRSFAELERQRLWPRAWQMACRLEELPSPGDYVE